MLTGSPARNPEDLRLRIFPEIAISDYGDGHSFVLLSVSELAAP
jgi:hypothetical protein